MNRDRDLYYLIANPLKINRDKIKVSAFASIIGRLDIIIP